MSDGGHPVANGPHVHSAASPYAIGETVIMPPSDQTVVVVAGGDPVVSDTVLDGIDEPALVVAADSGLEIAAGIGLAVNVVIGDMDSVDPAALAAATEGGVEVVRHPAAKDYTDLELALARATAVSHDRLVVVGGGGGRLSHLLSNAAVIAAVPGVVEWRLDRTVIRFARCGHDVEVSGAVGDLVSLIPFGGACTGVHTSGLEWVLVDATLDAFSSRGVSNVLDDPIARISVANGTLLVIHETPG